MHRNATKHMGKTFIMLHVLENVDLIEPNVLQILIIYLFFFFPFKIHIFRKDEPNKCLQLSTFHGISLSSIGWNSKSEMVQNSIEM